MQNKINEKLLKRVELIMQFYYEKGRMPTYSEIAHLLQLKSKNSVFKLIKSLEKYGFLKRDEKGKLILKNLSHPIKVLGTIEAGFPSPAEEILLDTISLDEFLVENPQATFLLKVTGDSMKDAGILPGDLVLVQRGLLPRNGDIVIAKVDGEWTMKYFMKEQNKIVLLPANPKYDPIIPKNELEITGVVIAVIRKYK
ncbi:MAG: repressor LexA [Dictyoglomus sp. NZ13-RE01]|nr:MAG: repressor LexA [Dictyoglomus sp. NZ13-RE01]